jgi:hypothetical protein
MRVPRVLVGSLVAGLAASAQGALLFDNRADFQVVTNAGPAAPIPNLGFVGQSQTVDTLTYSTPSSQMFMGTLGTPVAPDPWTVRIPGNQIALSGTEDLNVDLVHPTYAIGFDFVEPENDPNVNADFVDSTFTVTLYSGAVMVDSFSFNAPNDAAAFVGYWADSAFDRIEIRETTGATENEFYGQFYVRGFFADGFETGDFSQWSSKVP